MRRAVVGMAAVGALGLLAGCSAGTSPQAAPVTSSAAASSSPPAVTIPAGTPVTPSLPAPVPIAPPVTYSGVGDSNLRITKPAGATTVIATITATVAGHYFGVRALDGEQDHLVQTIGPYHGATLLDAHGGATTQLHVHAYGPWTITLSDPRTAPVFTSGYAGTGDTVLIYEGKVGSGAVAGTGSTASPFDVTVYSAGAAGQRLVHATGPYNSAVRWPSGPALIAVAAVGSFTIAIH